MKQMCEMTKTGDPMLKVKMPQPIIDLLHSVAKENKRRHQDEFIKRIAASFRNNDITESAQLELIPKVKELYQ
jgi:hypothetical protein